MISVYPYLTHSFYSMPCDYVSLSFFWGEEAGCRLVFFLEEERAGYNYAPST